MATQTHLDTISSWAGDYLTNASHRLFDTPRSGLRPDISDVFV